MRSRSSGSIGSFEWSIDGAVFDDGAAFSPTFDDEAASAFDDGFAAPCDFGVVVDVFDAGTAPCDFGVVGIAFFFGGGGPGGGPGGGGSSKVKTAGGISRSSDDDDWVLNHTCSSGSSAARFELPDADDLALAEIA